MLFVYIFWVHSTTLGFGVKCFLDTKFISRIGNLKKLILDFPSSFLKCKEKLFFIMLIFYKLMKNNKITKTYSYHRLPIFFNIIPNIDQNRLSNIIIYLRVQI